MIINWKYKECLKPLGNEYDHYIISGAGQVLMEAIDVNKDGKIDYVK